ncbi:chaperone protein dnaJ 16-like, partial [Panicum virgatum]|uniref:chaperone protein dnaJ 16-like n=1 Tax=Panicum virgatum TaxID=38727 RepID=UPI0019D6A679
KLELDLSSLNTVNIVFAALFSKLGVPIKTTVSATVLEEALNGSVEISQLQLCKSVCRKVEKQTAHFYSIDITDKEAKMGLACRVHSTAKIKFKLLYFEPEDNGGLSLALQLLYFEPEDNGGLSLALQRVAKAIKENSGNALLKAVKMSKHAGWGVMTSHMRVRSKLELPVDLSILPTAKYNQASDSYVL